MNVVGRFVSGLTLQKKIAVVAIAGLLLAISVFSYLGITALSRSTLAKLDERLTMATMLADYEDQVLGLAMESLEVAALSAHSETGNVLPQRELEILLATYSQMGIPVVGVFALDSQGNVVGQELLAGNMADWNVDAYPSLQATLATSKAGVSGVTQVPSFDKPVVLLSAPIQATRGALAVAVDLPESGVTGFMQPVKLGATGYAELVDSNGLVVARTRPGQAPAFFEKSDHPDKFTTLIATGQPMVGTCHRCHVEGEQTERRKDILAFAPLKLAAWGVVIRQSEEEALAPIRELKQQLTIAGALMAAITLFLIWLATSSIVTRIKSLKQASLRMASGDLSTPIPVHGKDELGTLAATMDSARLELKASYEAVEQRTKELSALLAISKTLTSAADMSMMLDLVVAKVVEVVPGCQGGLLLLNDGPANRFTMRSVVGIDSRAPLQGRAIQASDGRSVALGLPCAIPPELSPELSQLTKEVCATALGLEPLPSRVKHATSAPMVNRGHPVGILILVNFQEDMPFTHSAVSLLQTIADEVGIAVENVRLSRQAEEARLLRETDRLKSDFLSTVSHELRTPLASIKGYTTSLLREDVDWETGTGKEFLKAIDSKSDELRDLIDKLLQMARVEAGGLEMTREPVLLSRLAQEVVSEVSLAYPKHAFRVDFPTPFPVVEGDAHNLKIVLRNLVDNGVKYSPKGGTIFVSGRAGEKEVVISVSDQGIGIAPHDLSRIFGRFYRANNDVTRRVSGSGLGLAVVKAMVEAHNGKIWVESTEGKGSTFSFSLPAEREQVERDQDDKADVRTGGGRRPVASPVR